MNVYRARWLLPIARSPIRNGWIALHDGRVTALGGPADTPPAAPRDLGNVALLPGLVNAHTHLELSWLRGRVPPAASFVEWIKGLFVTRGGRSETAEDRKVTDAASDAVREMRECGTAGVGDISNSLASVTPIREGGLRGLVFHELLGFNLPTGQSVIDTRPLRAEAAVRGAQAVRVSVAPHAPYSVSPELFRAIREEVNRSALPITSVHLGESDSEVAFLRDGSGPWPGILKWVGSTRDDWSPPGLSPVAYLDRLGVLDARTLVVHAVQLQDDDLRRLAAIGCTVVTCPRSNQWVGVGVPPVARFYAAGLRVAVGTDSLASVDDLNLFNELKTMRWLAPEVPARQLLESATRIGAEALGLGDELGTIEVGKRAEVIAVRLPAWADDATAGDAQARELASGERRDASSEAAATAAAPVEEFLVRGITPQQIAWVRG